MIPEERQAFVRALFEDCNRAADEYHTAFLALNAAQAQLREYSHRLRELVDALDEEAGFRRAKPRRKSHLHPETTKAIAAMAPS